MRLKVLIRKLLPARIVIHPVVAGEGLYVQDDSVSVDFDSLTTENLHWLAREAGVEGHTDMRRPELIQIFIDGPMPLDWWALRLKTIFGGW